ncbi:carbohydrate kinase family protein [Halorarius litoreus]|uniref:carbohydrate kinase family protein n=1 Tax=Halorarius litoreus TaxID=2962676 RepID=UPI0020CDC79C|nr:PfkB family carbohydrate kinase [Halorarius litoreus]
MPRVLCAGHVNWDVTLRVDRLPTPDGESAVRATRQGGGGSAGNVAVGLVGLNCKAALLGSVGDDEHGQFARRDLDRSGVDLSGVVTTEGVTTTKYLLVDDEGRVAVLGAPGVNEALGPDDIDPDVVDGADHVHLTSQRPDTAARIAEVASDAGIPVSADPGRRLTDRDFGPVIEHADLLLLNRVEAEALGDLPDDREVVTKLGASGSRLRTPEATYSHPGFDLPAVDTTGAGDAFAAGFIAARLQGADPERMLAVANACGALGAATEGPKTDLSWERVEAVLAGERPGF